MSKRKPYIRDLPVDWWMKQLFYTKYMIREGSSVLVTIYALVLAWGLFRLSQGEVAFNAWLGSLQSPLAIIFHLCAFILALYHTITWFSLSPKLVDIQVGGKGLDERIIIAVEYIVFAIATVICFLVVI
ncbi:MAG: fumarate reductase subunit C [Psychromonas sp.]|nr:fumarate reductase subunit C [Psychromonas sp.]